MDRGSCPTMRPVKGSPEDKWSSELCKEGIICVNGRFVCDRDLCSRLNGGGVEDVREGLEHLLGFNRW